jgi:hypothetical protein
MTQLQTGDLEEHPEIDERGSRDRYRRHYGLLVRLAALLHVVWERKRKDINVHKVSVDKSLGKH